MKASTHILFSCLLVCLITTAGFSQVIDSTAQNDEHEKESSQTTGLRKIASGTQFRNMDFDINIDTEALNESIESVVNEAMESVETALENIDIHIDPIEINLDDLDIHIDPIAINIPNIDVEPIDLRDVDIDIDQDFNWAMDRNEDVDRNQSHDDEMNKDKEKVIEKSAKEKDKTKELKKIN